MNAKIARGTAMLVVAAGCTWWVAADETGKKGKEKEKGSPERVVKSDREWAKVLTREQYLVTRQKATEPPFTGKYVHNHAKGIYYCVCCDAELFSSKTKFDSGTGWPSFYRAYAPDHIDSSPDYSDGTQRVEVTCSRCGAHLGHVFDDGPYPTFQRFCINSAALKFVREEPTKAKAPAKKAKGKASDAPVDEDKDQGEVEADPPAEKAAPPKAAMTAKPKATAKPGARPKP